MALNLNKSQGTKSATAGGTEDTLLTESSSGIFVLFVNLKNMVNGDRVCLRAYTKVLTGDANAAVVYEQEYSHKAGDNAAPGSVGSGQVIVKSPPIESPFSLVWTLTQTAGSSRNFDWREDQLA